MLPLLVTALIWQGRPLLKTPYLPPASGKNGYEEYVRAAELLNDDEASRLMRWVTANYVSEGMTPEESARLKAMTPLEVRREALRKFGQTLDLVAQGNAKPVFDPRAKLGPDTLLPEFSYFRRIGTYAALVDPVYGADGRTDLATKAIINQLFFADNFGRGLMIANLSGVATTSIAIGSFQNLVPRLSEKDAKSVETAVTTLLARPPAIRETILSQASYGRQASQLLLAADFDAHALVGSRPTAEGPELEKEFKALSSSGRSALVASLVRRIDEQAKQNLRLLDGPEKGWAEKFIERQNLDDPNPTTLLDYLTSMFTYRTQFVESTVRNRTQLRLLALYAGAVRYRWNYGAWPAKLDRIDPINGEPYLYEVHEDGTIRIASKGTKTTGEIDLVYSRPSGPEEVRP